MKILKISSVAVASLVGMSSAVAFAGCGSCGPGEHKDTDKPNDKVAAGCATGVCADHKNVEAKAESAAVKEAVINTEGLAALIKSRTAVKVLDARSGKYDDGQRIPGATQLSPNADESVISRVLPDKNALIVTYCAGVKCPASKALSDRLKQLGYSNVIEYPQGIAGWLEAGNAVDKK